MRRLALLLVLALAGCPSGGDADGGGGSGASEAGELVAAVCAKQAECCAANETEAACRAGGVATVLETLFALPHLAFDEAAVEACVARVSSMGCEVARHHAGKPPVLLVCDPFFEGTQVEGGPCGGDDLGAMIFGDDQCTTGSCQGGVCVRRAQEGESCSTDCAEGLSCDPGTGTCARGHAEGESCERDGLCEDGLVCARPPGGGALGGLVPRVIAAGEPCADDGVCELGEDRCFCAPGEEGCATPRCGDAGRCFE